MADELQMQNPLNTKMNFYWLPVIRAAVQISRKDPEKPSEILQPTLPTSWEFPALCRESEHCFIRCICAARRI